MKEYEAPEIELVEYSLNDVIMSSVTETTIPVQVSTEALPTEELADPDLLDP